MEPNSPKKLDAATRRTPSAEHATETQFAAGAPVCDQWAPESAEE